MQNLLVRPGSVVRVPRAVPLHVGRAARRLHLKEGLVEVRAAHRLERGGAAAGHEGPGLGCSPEEESRRSNWKGREEAPWNKLLEGSFSAVSKPIVASQHSCCSFFINTHVAEFFDVYKIYALQHRSMFSSFFLF